MNDERSHIDPQGKYPSDGLRLVEENAAKVLSMLPSSIVERTRDCIQIDYGGDKGIVVLVTAEAIELRMPTVEWTMGSYGPASSSRLWKRVKYSGITDSELKSLLNDALKHRANEFKKCRYCGQSFPPEHRHGNVCHCCAEKHSGVVH